MLLGANVLESEMGNFGKMYEREYERGCEGVSTSFTLLLDPPFVDRCEGWLKEPLIDLNRQ